MPNIFESSKRQGNIIKNEDVLNYEYVPKILPFREGQVQEIAESIKPMLEERKGTNLFIFGAPGIGKTASIKWVLRELDEHTDEIIPLYVNCWNLKTKYFIFMEMANKLKISFIAGKSAEHVLQQLVYRLKDKKIVFVFDEVDKAEDSDFLYQIIESFPKSTILLASNVRDYTINMDPRIKSRMMIRSLEFKPYTISEINKILSERVKIALKSDVLDPSLIKQI
jgi:cell division control protein 6